MTAQVVDSAGLTQTGNVRRTNEDSFLLRSPLFMVADGMGGALAGELASRMCAEAFAELDLIEHQGEEALRSTIGVANRRIWERSRTDVEASGMGTTVTAALVGENGAVSFAHVGDSRAYLLRDGALQRLSEDHSLVHELMRAGELSEIEAEQHPQRSVITRALGTDEDVQIDTFSLDAQPDDVLLLCTDGLNTMVSEQDIAAVLASPTTVADIARRLVRAALKAGGEDNVTAVVVRFGAVAPAGADEEAAPDGAVRIAPRPAAGRDGRRGRRRGLRAGDRGRDRPSCQPLHRSRHVDGPGRDLPGRPRRAAVRRPPLPRHLRVAGELRLARSRPAQEPFRPYAALRVERPPRPPPVRGGQPVRSARMRELWNLGWVGGLTAIGFLSVYTARQNEISSASLTYAAVFLGVFGLAHIGVRAGLPHADPWLLPLAALLCALGLTEIYRLSPTLARDQSVWVVIGLLGFLGMVFLVRDHRRLEPYTYLLATTAVGLLLVTMAVGTTINGAKLWLRFGGVQVQPGEFAKLLLVIALASYLREHREVLTMAHRTVLGVGLPAARHLGPLALMAGISLGVLAVMNDLGSALLLFGIYLSMIYVATGRHLYTVLGLGLFAAGSWAVYRSVGHVQERFHVWVDPWAHPHTTGYQIIQSIEAIADGGIFGTGLGRSLQVLNHGQTIIPAVQTDGIYAAWADETGLAGAAGLLLIYLLFCYRGFKIAAVADDGFSKLLACGLTFAFGLQAFLIVGGIIRLIPLTGITLPFVSYGGSSIVSNFVMLALLLMVSNRAAERA
jgi:cell division protein FtsW (lipid II flippase)/serine/threonine protein phosphatase PrpC